jgi:hypothetical protein
MIHGLSRKNTNPCSQNSASSVGTRISTLLANAHTSPRYVRPKLPSVLLDEICYEGKQIASRDKVFQYDVSIVSIAAGAPLRRSSLPFAHRGECAIFRISTRAVEPDTIAVANSRS